MVKILEKIVYLIFICIFAKTKIIVYVFELLFFLYLKRFQIKIKKVSWIQLKEIKSLYLLGK